MRKPAAQRRARSRAEGSGVTLGQLRVFGVVADGEHLTRAAKSLRMSQGSVSAHVRRLEGALGLPLLDRVGRNIRLTPFGRSLRPLAYELIEKARAIDELALRFQQADQGRVSIAAGAVIGAHRLGGWLSPFVQAHPGIEVRIVVTGMQKALEALAKCDVDVAILGAGITAPGIESIGLERTELVIVVASSHALAASADPLRELSRHRYLVHEHGSATQMQAERVLTDHVDGSARLELDESALLAALHTGLGFAVMPRAIVEADIAAGRLITVPYPGRRVRVVFTAARRFAANTPAVNAFWRHLGALTLA